MYSERSKIETEMAEAHISFKDAIILRGLMNQIKQLQETCEKTLARYKSGKLEQQNSLIKFLRSDHEQEYIDKDEYIEYQLEDLDSSDSDQESDFVSSSNIKKDQNGSNDNSNFDDSESSQEEGPKL